MARSLYVKYGESFRPAADREVRDAAAKLIALEWEKDRPCMSDAQAGKFFVRTQLGHLEHEEFCAIYLDCRHKVIEFERLFRGTVDGASVHPREVVKACLLRNAAAVIFAHNHPSGVAEPSHADELITRRLRDALELIDVKVLDHLIVGSDTVTSFVERGLM